MTDGWIKLHRQFRQNPFYSCSTAVHLWVECLLRATHQEAEFYAKRSRVRLKPGQFVMGYRELARTVGCGVATAKYWMDQFESERMIERSATPKGSIVKVKNWDRYQEPERVLAQERNADGTLMEPYKNEKNDKKNTDTTYPTGGSPKRKWTPEQEKELQGFQSWVLEKLNERRIDKLTTFTDSNRTARMFMKHAMHLCERVGQEEFVKAWERAARMPGFEHIASAATLYNRLRALCPPSSKA